MTPRTVYPSDDVTRALHKLQFAERISGLPLAYYAQPWYTKRRWRWTAIAIAALALIAACATGDGGIASW